MKCENCGFEALETFKFCPACGKEVENRTEEAAVITEYVETVIENPMANKFLAAVKDKLFLAICILLSVSCIFAIAAESLPIIEILITIFSWITFAQGRKGIADDEHLRCISGSVYANYVLMNILSGLLIFLGGLVALAFALIGSQPELVNEIIREITINVPDFLSVPQELYAMVGWIFGFAFILMAVIILIVNLCGFRKIHRFIKSVYQGIRTQSPVCANPASAKGWLIFFGVCSALSALTFISDTASAIYSACSSAVAIISAILIKKYFSINE